MEASLCVSRVAHACVVACLAAAPAAASAQVIEASFTWEVSAGGNGHSYSLISIGSGIDWATAQADAEARGGYLATLTSMAENNIVYDMLGIGTNDNVWHVDQYASRIGPWLGGLQMPGSSEPGGGWQWITGEAFSFTNWSPGNPDNFGTDENRIHFFGNPTRNSYWNDIPASAMLRGYVVETNVPAPATTALAVLAALVSSRRRR